MDLTPRSREDDGLSLIELLIYMILIGLIGALVVTLFINIWQTERSVNDKTTATSEGQLIASQIEKAMRNAIGFAIEDDGRILKVVTSLGESAQCQSFAFETDGVVMSITPAPATQESAGSWQQSVTQTGSTQYFVPADADGVRYSFTAHGRDGGAAVLFTGEVHSRNATLEGVDSCW